MASIEVKPSHLFPEGVRIVSDGRSAEVFDIATGEQVRYVSRIGLDIDANRRPFLSLRLEVDVPRVEYQGPVTNAKFQPWPPLDVVLESAERESDRESR